MKLNTFKNKNKDIEVITDITKKDDIPNRVRFKKPLICLIDIENKIKDNLEEKGFNITSGTLGKIVEVPNSHQRSQQQQHMCLLNCSFPQNLHEYEIFIIDLEDKGIIPYDIKQHTRKYVEGFSVTSFLSSYPETLFNPKPFGSSILGSRLLEIKNKAFMLIIFAASREFKEYHIVEESITGFQPTHKQTFTNYNFCSKIPYSENKVGKELVVQKEPRILFDLLSKHISGATYQIVFKDLDPNNNEKFMPLIKNSQNEIVSFLKIFDNCMLFVFPQISDKNSFLSELLTNQLPTLCPGLFPFNSEFKWIEEEAYMLPNQELLLKEKENLIKEFNEKIEGKEKEIEANHEKYECLHRLLTESGDELVKYVKIFLEWLGFENVKIMDEPDDNKKLEEDLQVEVDEGLLVIEVKGIGGTSTDAECSQIEKIKNRRTKERKKFDVFGLYIVNHQRYQPPLFRENPPFKEHQIEDAINDERGLLSTWQLFNLYFSIKNESITKEEARKALLKSGLIKFLPQNCTPLGKPKNVLRNGEIVTLDLLYKIENNNELIIKRGDKYLKTRILEIQVQNKRLETVESGPVGVKVGIPIKKSDELFIKSSI